MTRARPFALVPVIVALSLVASFRAGQAACDAPQFIGARWCDAHITVDWGPGFDPICAPGSECDLWKNAVRTAMAEWNQNLFFTVGGPTFLEGGNAPIPFPGHLLVTMGQVDLGQEPSCGGFIPPSPGSVQCTCVPPAVASLATTCPHVVPGSGEFNEIESACLDINTAVPWTPLGHDRRSIARHELGHVLGLSHSNGDCLMKDATNACTEMQSIDAHAADAMFVLYGDPLGSTFPQAFGFWPQTDGTNWIFLLGRFDGTQICGVPGPPPPANRTYELAVNEDGGPFSTFVTKPANQVSGNIISYAFTHGYRKARFRLRVFDDAVQVGESVSPFPMNIVPAITGVEPVAPANGAILVYPNPSFAGATIRFVLERPSTVSLRVYDVAGRVVAAPATQSLGAGAQSTRWDGRRDDGGLAPAGAYRVVLRTDSEEKTASVILVR